MIHGAYWRKLLRINLSNSTYSEEEIPEITFKEYLGGAGLGIKYLADEVDPEIDALSEANKLFLSLGPLTGTDAPCASRMSVVAKSPLTGAVGNSLTGGYFPAELKFLGYDLLIIEGKAKKPIYLKITEEGVKFRSAKKIWGINTFDTQQVLKDDLGDQNYRVLCIGPAGEKMIKMASIINERHAAGRKGLGAVMGSKNLKAIAIRGTKKVPIADEPAFKAAIKEMQRHLKESPVLYPQFSKTGTPMVVEATWGIGIFPANNYAATGEGMQVETLGLEANEKHRLGSEHCYKCPVGCSQMKLIKKGRYAGNYSNPEFESMYSFGSMTAVNDIDYVTAADRICDELGLDTISAGVTIAFAMELYEKGILTKEDTDGLDLRFGNGEAMLDTLLKLSNNEDGIGHLLANGSAEAARNIGGDAMNYTIQVKGLELPGYDVRGAKAHGLSMATSYTGGDHNRGYAFQEIFGIPVPEAVDRFAIEKKGALTKWNQDFRSSTCDCAPMCAFLLDMALPGNCADNTAALVNASAGMDFTPEMIVQVGERLNNLARLFNIGAGFTRNDDTLPYRIMHEPIAAGASKGHYIPQQDLDTMLDEYYSERGWDASGTPTENKLKELNLTKTAQKLLRKEK